MDKWVRAAVSWIEGRRFLMRCAFSAREVFLGLRSQPRELSGWAGMSRAVGPEGSNESGNHERSLPPFSHRLGWSAAPKTFLGLRTNPNGEKKEHLPRVAPPTLRNPGLVSTSPSGLQAFRVSGCDGSRFVSRRLAVQENRPSLVRGEPSFAFAHALGP